MLQRVAWGLLALLILIIMFAPLAAYCLQDDEDGDEASAPNVPMTRPAPFIAGAPIVASGVSER
jgi:hypothetical protein